MFDFDPDALPALGVGLSLSFGMEPDPVALARTPGGPAFIEYAGAVQHDQLAGPLAELARMGVPALFHPSCLNLCGPWPNPPGWLDAAAAHVAAAGSPWLAQDVAVCFVGDTPGYSIQLGYFVPPILTRASLEQAVERVLEVRARVPAPLLLEPPPVTFKAGELSIFEWLGALAERTGCGLLLDAGHVVSHQLAAGRDLTEGLEALDLDRVIELHVAGGVLRTIGGRGYYLDAHDLPILPETWAVFDHLLRRCANLKAICVECEGAAAGAILPVVQRVRQQIVLAALSAPLREATRAQMSGRPVAPQALGGAGGPPDPRPAPADDGATDATDGAAGRQYEAMIRLLLDPVALASFEQDPEATLEQAGLSGEDAAPLLGADPVGLALDAEGRRRYLMSALCRAYPLTAAAIGAGPGGPERLALFLGSPAVFGPLGARTLAFGDHLAALLEHLDAELRALMEPVLTWERGLAESAGRIRQAVAEGRRADAPPSYSKGQIKRGKVALPPFLIAAHLPVPTAVLRGALEGVGPGDAWPRILGGGLSLDRVRTVARAPATPVTALARSYAVGASLQRAGAGGAAPLVEVRHLAVELSGLQSRLLSRLDGTSKLTDLPASDQRVVRGLLEARLLELR